LQAELWKTILIPSYAVKKCIWCATGCAKSGRFSPLQSVPFVRTTWGEWRKQHPNSDLFTGNSN
jgi:hypothetical protein